MGMRAAGWPCTGQLHSLNALRLPVIQVNQLMDSPVTPDIHLDEDLSGRSYRAAVEYFTDKFPDAAKIHLIGADQDQIVRPLEVRPLFGVQLIFGLQLISHHQ